MPPRLTPVDRAQRILNSSSEGEARATAIEILCVLAAKACEHPAETIVAPSRDAWSLQAVAALDIGPAMELRLRGMARDSASYRTWCEGFERRAGVAPPAKGPTRDLSDVLANVLGGG